MQSLPNLKYWISNAAGIVLTVGLIIGNAGDQGLINKESRNYRWLMLFIGSGGAVSLFLNGADKMKPWEPESTNGLAKPEAQATSETAN